VKRLEIDARRGAGRPLVLVLLVVIALVATTLWYREGTSGPLHAMRTGLTAASEPFAAVGTWVTTPLRAAESWVSSLAIDKSEYTTLKAQNLALKQTLATLEEAKLQNDRIQALVSFATTSNLATVGAQIIGRSTDSRQRSILVDRGTNSGVKLDDAVIAAGGLVGQVVEVTPWNARVRLVTDSESGVAVLVQRTRAAGIVKGSPDGSLALDFVSKKKPPTRGDVLITSGLGGVYPKGIVVGEVTNVSTTQSDLYAVASVASRVEIDHIEEVLVLRSKTTAATQTGGGE
jgi:rod shape-determining protein MreC